MEEETKPNEFMVEWQYTYTYFGHCSCGCDRHQENEIRTTGRQFKTIDDVKDFIKKNVFENSQDFRIASGGIKNIRVFKLNKLEVKLGLE